jgi:predicted DNA-binding transcriptional regulator AlpA
MTIQSLIADTRAALEMTKLSHATLYRVLLKDPTFPKPFKIGLRKNAWLRSDIEAWINARAAEVAA